MLPADKGFTLSGWTRATFYGWVAGVVFVLLLSSLLDGIGIEGMQFYLGTGMSLGVSFFQWRVIRKFMTITKGWIVHAVTGMSVPFLIVDVLPHDLPYKLPMSIVLGSLAVGFLQYRLLRPHSQKAHIWIAGCLAGWTLAVGTVFLVDYTKQLTPIISSNLVLALINLFLILAGGLVLGLGTGLALKKVIR